MTLYFLIRPFSTITSSAFYDISDVCDPFRAPVARKTLFFSALVIPGIVCRGEYNDSHGLD